MRSRRAWPLLTLSILASVPRVTTSQPSATAPSVIDFPGVQVDRAHHQVRVECQALAVETPLEFFCVTNGGPEHESVLRTLAKPSHIHAGLLMLGLEPGSPVKFIESKNAWSAPFGPPIRVSVEWKDAEGKAVRRPAESLMRSTKDKDIHPKSFGWIFAGSHQRAGDGAYLADLTGYVVTLCNFENALVDVPRLVSSANETLEWEADPSGPKRGEPVTMILEPAGALTPSTQPASTQPSTSPADRLEVEGLTPEQAAQKREIAALRDDYRVTMAPHEQAMHEAARAHYEAIEKLRARQKKLIDEADALDALIDELDREYAEMTTPKP